MSNIILDSGILIASVFPETLTPQAQQLIRQLQSENITLHAPSSFPVHSGQSMNVYLMP